jgi:hypothetical protein
MSNVPKRPAVRIIAVAVLGLVAILFVVALGFVATTGGGVAEFRVINSHVEPASPLAQWIVLGILLAAVVAVVAFFVIGSRRGV